MKIHEAIKCRRIELNLTLEEVGRACGVTKSAVCKWERGSVSSLKADVLTKLAAVLKCNPIELVNEEVEKLGVIPLENENEKRQLTEKQAAALEIIQSLNPDEIEKAKEFVKFLISQRDN